MLAATFGFVDDKWQIRARWQFIFQLSLAAFAILLGLQILEINNPLEFLGESSLTTRSYSKASWPHS